MKFIKNAFLLLTFALFVAAPVAAVVTSQSTYAAVTNAKDCERTVLGIPTWFRGLSIIDSNGKCSVAGPGQALPSGATLELSQYIWFIALNLIDIALTIVGIIAFLFIIYGGFQFLTGGNEAGKVEQARKTILHAVIGLVISIGAVAIINLIFGIIG